MHKCANWFRNAFASGCIGAKSSSNHQKQPSILTIKDVLGYLKDLDDADQVADIVSCTLLPGAVERQTILETVEVVPRLRRLIDFLLAEIKEQKKTPGLLSVDVAILK